MSPQSKLRPRKQALQARAQVTVEAILGATARILVKQGYDQLTTNRVALAAGVSIGSLYQYFPSKEALVAALVDDHVEKMLAMVTTTLHDMLDAPIATAVRALVRLMIESHGMDPKLHKVFTEQVPRMGGLDRVFELEAQATTMVRGYLEAHREEIRPKNLDVAAFVLVNTVEALTHAAVLRCPEMLNHQLEAEITDLIVQYLGGG
ncbi:MAG: TetR/AcrR family transcriptional regulator [Polyangiales bacterium]